MKLCAEYIAIYRGTDYRHMPRHSESFTGWICPLSVQYTARHQSLSGHVHERLE